MPFLNFKARIISAHQIEQSWCLEIYKLFIPALKQLAHPLFSSYSEVFIVISSQFLLVFLEPMKNGNFWICHQLWPSKNWSIHPLCLSAILLSVYWFSLRPICRYSSKHIFRVYVLYWYLLLSKYNRKTHMNCFFFLWENCASI